MPPLCFCTCFSWSVQVVEGTSQLLMYHFSSQFVCLIMTLASFPSRQSFHTLNFCRNISRELFSSLRACTFSVLYVSDVSPFSVSLQTIASCLIWRSGSCVSWCDVLTLWPWRSREIGKSLLMASLPSLIGSSLTLYLFGSAKICSLSRERWGFSLFW